jgi:hypothetical protein
MQSDVEYTKAAMNIERHTEKDPKRFTTYTDIETQLKFFFDDEREKLIQSSEFRMQKENMVIPEDIAKKFVDEYSQDLNLDMTVEEWFAQLKEI